jgi:hypothetical protein
MQILSTIFKKKNMYMYVPNIFKLIILITLSPCYYSIYAQVRLSAESGLNLRPYCRNGIGKCELFFAPEPYLGVQGEFNLQKQFSLMARVRYNFRYITSASISGIAERVTTRYINQDLIVNIGVVYRISDNWQIGSGIGFYHKLNAYMEDVYSNDVIKTGFNYRVLPNSLLQMEYCKGRLRYQLVYEYLYRIERRILSLTLMALGNANNSLSFGVSYEFYKTKKK